MSMYTDPDHLKIEDPGKIEGNVVFTYLDAFCSDEHFEKYLPEYKNLDELKDHYKKGGLGDVTIKKFLNSIIQEELEPIRNKLLEYFEIKTNNRITKNIYLPYSFIELASYLSIDRSAMHRELRNLQDEGLIEIKNKKITLKY